MQKAVDKIIQINDGETEYSIFIDGTVTAPDTLDSSTTLNFIKIEPQKKLKIKIASLSSTQAVINANKKAGVIDVVGKSETEKTTLVLQNVCITGGKTQSDDVGGGIKAQYTDITLKAGTVIGTKLLPEENKDNVASSSTYGNYAEKGGGIYLNGCTLTIEDDVYICQNYSVNDGGGIAAEGNSKIIAKGGIIGFNQASSGGGIYIYSGNAELTDCTVCMNKAGNNGGGIYVADTELTLNAGTVIGNKNASQTANLSNWNNYAYYNGGGIYAINASVTVNEDSAVLFNVTSRDSGGGLYVKNGTLTIKGAKINYNYSSINKNSGSGGGGIRLAGNATMRVEGSNSEIAYNGSAFKGAGLQLIDDSSCTMHGGSIHDNKNSGLGEEGGGVCISSGTTFTMTGGTIYGNKHGTASNHEFGDGIYVEGTLNLSGTAHIAPDNDVYLAAGTYVTVTGELTEESAVATVTPDSYTEDRVIVKGSDSYNLSSSDCSKFTVTKDSANNKFYCVSFDTSSNTGILEESQTVVSPELPGVSFIPSTKALSILKVQEGAQKISFSVQKKMLDSGATGITYKNVTPSKAKIALYQNGSPIKNHSAEASNSLPEFTLQPWLPEGTYSLYMTATVDGIEYSAWEPFVIASQIPISSLSSAPDARYCPSLAAETGEDFKKLDEWVQNGSTLEGITITLTYDIDLTAETDWKPIGFGAEDDSFSDTNAVPFKGTLNGNGKSIKLQVSSEEDMIGLVQINEGTIENLVVEQYTEEDAQLGDDTARGSRGGAFCVINNGTIRNCVNKAGLKSYTYWGIAGICYINKGTIENCLNTGTIEITTPELWAGAWTYNAGIAAENYGSIENCVNAGEILTKELATGPNYVNYFAGTVAGRMYYDAVISNCYWLKNSLIREGTGGNECVTFVEKNISYYAGEEFINTIPDPSKITGCGYFDSFSASAALTAGDTESCKSTQTLSYGTTLKNALNGYVNANPDKELKQWQTAEDGTITLGF